MRDAVIVDAVRTPVGKRNGAYASVHPVDLSAHVLTALAERTGGQEIRYGVQSICEGGGKANATVLELL
jgi:acetyl-CoA acetyltransferase